jgi:hypothetical protein
VLLFSRSKDGVQWLDFVNVSVSLLFGIGCNSMTRRTTISFIEEGSLSNSDTTVLRGVEK